MHPLHFSTPRIKSIHDNFHCDENITSFKILETLGSLVQTFEVEVFDFFPRPGGCAEKFKARRNTRIFIEAFDPDAASQ